MTDPSTGIEETSEEASENLGDGPSADPPNQAVPDEAYSLGGLGSLVRRVGWAGAAEIAQLASVMISFKVLSDRLGIDAYGLLGGAYSIAVIAGPISTIGANWILLRDASVVENPKQALGRAISISGLGTIGGVLLIAVAVGFWWQERMPLAVLVPVLLAQMTAHWFTELASTAAVAQARLKLSARLRLSGGLIRLAAVAAWVGYELLVRDSNVESDLDSLYSWVWFFLLGNALVAFTAHAMVARAFGGWPSVRMPSKDEYRQGWPYGLGNSTEGLLTASDQVVLTDFDYRQNGAYAAGVRIVTLGFIPMMALFKAQDRRFFRQGARGSHSSHRAALAMAKHTLMATVPVACALALMSPLLTLVIDDRFSESESVIRWLAVLPVIKGVQFAFGNGLTAAGNQVARLSLTAVVAVGNLIGNLFLIPLWGWQAAAVTTLVSELGLTLALFAASIVLARKGDEEPGSVDEASGSVEEAASSVDEEVL